jgi:hypothetical protein
VVLEGRDVGVVDLREQAVGQRPGAGRRVVRPAAGGWWALDDDIEEAIVFGPLPPDPSLLQAFKVIATVSDSSLSLFLV